MFALLLDGCGGSHKASTSTPATTGSTSSVVVTTAPGTTSTGAGTASTKSTTSTGGSGSGGSGSGGSGSGGAGSGGSGSGGSGSGGSSTPGGSSNARLPATYVIGKGDNLNPPTVTAPSFIAVALTVVSGDGRAHRVVIRTAPARTLNVPAGGHASVLLAGLADGRYVLEIDGGRSAGSLLVGGEPGP